MYSMSLFNTYVYYPRPVFYIVIWTWIVNICIKYRHTVHGYIYC